MINIKQCLILISFMTGVGFTYSQNAQLTLGHKSIDLVIDSTSTITGYTMFKRSTPVVPQTVLLKNIPVNKYDAVDGYGRPSTGIDNQTEYKLHLTDTISKVEDLKIELIVGGKKIDKVVFCFQSLSTAKRISHTRSTEMQAKDAGNFLQTSIDVGNSPVIILYALEFSDTDGTIYLLNIGYSGFFCR